MASDRSVGGGGGGIPRAGARGHHLRERDSRSSPTVVIPAQAGIHVGLRTAIDKHRPDLIAPEVEAIRTEVLKEVEDCGLNVVPSARATMMTMNRDRIREVAATELGLPTSRYLHAESLEDMREAVAKVGVPCVVKPVMSSSGKGQSMVNSAFTTGQPRVSLPCRATHNLQTPIA